MMDDAVFDKLCVRLLSEYEDLSPDRKAQIDKGDLEAGTCLKKLEDFSSYVIGASEFWIRWEDKFCYTT